MLAEQFKVINDGKGYKIAKSKNVDQWLSQENFQRVAYPAWKKDIEWTIIESWLEKIGIYACSFLKRGTDDHGRPITTNHTILLRFRDATENVTKKLDFETVFFQQNGEEFTKLLPPVELQEK